MFSLPPYILLIPYTAFLLLFAFFSFANIFSLSKYGARNTIGFVATFVYTCGIAIVLFMTLQALSGTDWSTPVPILNSATSVSF